MKRLAICISLLALVVGACSEEPKAVNQNRGEETDEEFTGGGEQTVANANEAFSVWCQKAKDTKVVATKMSKYYDKFCSGGKPTSLFAKSLPSVAYTGSGDPEPKKLATTEVEGKYVIVSLGTAIKIPISMKTHFDVVGPKGGDEAAQEELGQAQDAEVDVQVRESFSEDGEYHVRGWEIYTKTVSSESGINITTETVGRSDQHKLQEGVAYLYSSYITESIQGIKETDLFTAGVQVGDSAYLLTQAYIVADAKGSPKSLAEQLVLKTAKGLMESMYKAAAKAK